MKVSRIEWPNVLGSAETSSVIFPWGNWRTLIGEVVVLSQLTRPLQIPSNAVDYSKVFTGDEIDCVYQE